MEGATPSPQVFVVDSQAGAQLPLRPTPWWTHKMAWFLLLLVLLALLGVLVEAVFIYHLYHRPLPQGDSASSSAQKGAQGSEENEIEILPTKRTAQRERLPNPSAHLTATTENGVVIWGTFGDAFVQKMDASNNRLLARREGYYYIYSKVLFTEPNCSMFKHTVMRHTARYKGPIKLMEARRSHCHSYKETEILNSYLGGIFHLYAGDSVSIELDNHTLLRHQEISDNFFGAFMI